MFEEECMAFMAVRRGSGSCSACCMQNGYYGDCRFQTNKSGTAANGLGDICRFPYVSVPLQRAAFLSSCITDNKNQTVIIFQFLFFILWIYLRYTGSYPRYAAPVSGNYYLHSSMYASDSILSSRHLSGLRTC